MTTAKKSAKKTPSKKSSAKKTSAKTAKKGGGDNCWPGFQHTPGTTPGEKGSCEPVPGEHSKGTKRATQKAAAASKLEKAGKPNPKAKK